MKRIPIALFILSISVFIFTGAIDDDTLAKKNATDDYHNSITATTITNADQLGWTGRNCKPGHLSHETYVKMLTRINYFRRLAGVHDDIVLDSAWNKLAQAAAVIMNANNLLTHDPGPALKCYSADGKLGASTSNLGGIDEHSIPLLINDLIQDGGSTNKDCGHRRWLLYSQSRKMGIGITPGAYAVKVTTNLEENQKDTTIYHGSTPEYFAYPFQGFVPCQVVYPKWSFAIPGVADFATSTVEVKVGSKIQPITIISRGKVSYGDPTLIWTVKGLKEDFDYHYYDMTEKANVFRSLGMLDKKVTVKISNVKVNGKLKAYTYSFTIFDADEVK